MRNLIIIIGLKLRLLLRRPVILAFCVIIPILLSLLAGATVSRNELTHIRGAYVDLAENSESRKLSRMFEDSHFDWEERDLSTISRSIELEQLDGVIVIPEGFGNIELAATIDDAYVCDFIPGKNDLAADMVHENFVVAVIALAMETKLNRDLLSLEGASSLTDGEMRKLLEDKTIEARKGGAVLKMTVHDEDMDSTLPLIQVPDVAIEILFLSIFLLLSSLMLADADTQRRLRSLPGGFRRDYIAGLISLALAGILQLATMLGVLSFLMPETSRPANYVPVMSVLLLLMLAFGQFVALIPADRRFVPASLLLFVSVLAGGTFLRLPSSWMERVGQYTPHGWALASLARIKTDISIHLAGSLAVILIVLAYHLQKRSDYLSAS
ncbi:MAG: hypothetical protein PHR78_04565 [Eubacteriales bacterium]|nr:hypothetical protein [Eubacteriales bacterium]